MSEYIKREDVVKQFDPATLAEPIKEMKRRGFSEQAIEAAKERAIEIAKIVTEGVNAIPAADVAERGSEIVNGSWIPVRGNPIEGICSECKAIGNRRTKYCCDCGARMDGDAND